MLNKSRLVRPIYDGERSESVNGYVTKVLEFENAFDESKDFEKAALYSALCSALRTEWFTSIGYYSKIDICKQSKYFLTWLEEQQVNSFNYSDILNAYAIYRINDCELKPQSSGCKVVARVLRNGLKYIKDDYLPIIRHIIWNTEKIIRRDRAQITLSQYFTDVHWLRSCMEETEYLQIESPKRLISSLTTFASTLLIEIKQAKKKVQAFLDNNPFENSKYHHLTSQKRELGYSCYLIRHLMQLDDQSKPMTLLSELLIADLISINYEDLFLMEWRKHKREPLSFVYQGRVILPFVKAKMFHRESLNKPSRVEELLMRWLCAAQCVQANDINHLKKSNFCVEINSVKKPLYVQCQYYKGRGQKDYFTPLIPYEDIEAKAINSYLNYFDDPSEKLFRHRNLIQLFISSSRGGVIKRLASIFRLKNTHIIHSLAINHKKNKSVSIFADAFRSLINNGSDCYQIWEKKQESLGNSCSMSLYRKSVDRPLPANIFTPTAIKNSSVHARSDKYRDGDLVNYNSHSSETEKLHYLSDENKDWVNLNGRLTRLVMNDLDSYVYRPNLNLSIKKVKNSLLQTKVISATGIKDASVLALQASQEPMYEVHKDEIIVLDTESTVINMLYYIEQSKMHYDYLIRHSLEYFEKTVLPTVEWMHYVLEQKLTPSIVKEGAKSYGKIKLLLPNKFSRDQITL